MKHRQDGSQVLAAAKAGISTRAARRIDSQLLRQPRPWRTQADLLIDVWDSIVLALLERSPTITAIGLFDHVCEHHTQPSHLRSRRTLERRVQAWRQLHGPNQDVVFLPTHAMGELGIADFTVGGKSIWLEASDMV